MTRHGGKCYSPGLVTPITNVTGWLEIDGSAGPSEHTLRVARKAAEAAVDALLRGEDGKAGSHLAIKKNMSDGTVENLGWRFRDDAVEDILDVLEPFVRSERRK